MEIIYESNKFNENLSSGSRVFVCGRTDMMNIIVAFHNFAIARNEISVTFNEGWYLLVTYFVFVVYSVTVAMYQTRGIQL